MNLVNFNKGLLKSQTHYAAACISCSKLLNWPGNWQLLKAANADGQKLYRNQHHDQLLSQLFTYLLAAHLTPPTAGFCLLSSYLGKN
jgi:hypothetical protein